MGKQLLDQYSLLHFSVGVIFYFWNVNFIDALMLHVIFEIIENTNIGIKLINQLFVGKGIFSWPGGKNELDTFINILGDNISFIFGWYIAKLLDDYGSKNGWYIKHKNY